MRYIMILVLLLQGCSIDPIDITVHAPTPTPTPVATMVVE